MYGLVWFCGHIFVGFFVLYFSSASLTIASSVGIRKGKHFWPWLLQRQTSLVNTQPSPRRFTPASPELLTPADTIQWQEATDVCANVTGLKALLTLYPLGLWVLPAHIHGTFLLLPTLPALPGQASVSYSYWPCWTSLSCLKCVLMLPSPF